jgi:hypothetical protein
MGNVREWDKSIRAVEGLPKKGGTEEVGDSISLE